MWCVIQERTGSLYFSIKQKIKLEYDIIRVWASVFPLDCISCSVTSARGHIAKSRVKRRIVQPFSVKASDFFLQRYDSNSLRGAQEILELLFYSDKDLKRMI